MPRSKRKGLPRGESHWTHKRKPPERHDPDDLVISRIEVTYGDRQRVKVIAAQLGKPAEEVYGKILNVALGYPDLAERVRSLFNTDAL